MVIIDALDVLCAQLTHHLFAIAKFLLLDSHETWHTRSMCHYAKKLWNRFLNFWRIFFLNLKFGLCGTAVAELAMAGRPPLV